jgi:hypothetical protein
MSFGGKVNGLSSIIGLVTPQNWKIPSLLTPGKCVPDCETYCHAIYWASMLFSSHVIYICRVIHKSLRDFRPLRYSSRDGHAEGEHVNRRRDTPSFCPTLRVLDMATLGVCLGCRAADFGSSGGTCELLCVCMCIYIYICIYICIYIYMYVYVYVYVYYIKSVCVCLCLCVCVCITRLLDLPICN